jgi:hypothetical protein
MVIAGVAAIVWWAATPGTLISQVALSAVLIGGITTVVVNLNPLIPLDGYYALSDWLEVPNLRQRAFGHLGWLARRHLFRSDPPMPAARGGSDLVVRPARYRASGPSPAGRRHVHGTDRSWWRSRHLRGGGVRRRVARSARGREAVAAWPMAWRGRPSCAGCARSTAWRWPR